MTSVSDGYISDNPFSKTAKSIRNLWGKTASHFSTNDGGTQLCLQNTSSNMDINEPQRSSPLWTKQLNVNWRYFGWEVTYALQVYSGAILHAWDTATDFAVIANWIELKEASWLIILAISIILFYRFISAVVLGKQFGWLTGLSQMLDFSIYVEVHRSLQNKHCTLTNELKWIRRMEAIFESAPQAILFSAPSYTQTNIIVLYTADK